MKIKLILLTLSFAAVTYSQDSLVIKKSKLSNTIPAIALIPNSPKIKEPQYTGRMLYVKNFNLGQYLEQQKASSKIKVSALTYVPGLGKTTGTNKIKGAQSSVRLEEKENLQFIVRVQDNNVDPFQLINIFKLEKKIKKKKAKSFRYVETLKVETFSGASSMDIKLYQFDAEKYGDYSFLVTITEPLKMGEYAITLEGSRGLFNMFGID